jgi:uncharacterized membrane protein YdjX (TVP38/TMEM64 family)
MRKEQDFKCIGNFNPKLKREVEIIDTILAIILVALSIISLLSYNFYKEQINEQVLLYGRFGLVFFTAFLEFVPNFLNPYLPLVVSIPIFGLYSSLILVILGSCLGSILGFELGRIYGFRILCPLFKEKSLRKILVFWKKYGKWFVTLGALTPLPYFPIVFGALGMSRREFWIYGVLVRVISFILVAYGFYLVS